MRAIFAAFRRLPAPFWVLAGGTFMNRFATFLIPFMTLFMSRSGYKTEEITLTIISYAVGGFLCSFVAGPLADRFGRNRVMGGSLLLEGLCVLGVGYADTFPSILTMVGLAGFVAQAAQPATQALIADIVPDKDRVAAQLAIRVAINGGWALGPAVGGMVVVTHSYQWLFVADAITSSCFAILAWMCLPRGRPSGKAGGKWGPALKALRACPPMIGILLATLCASFVFRQLCTTVSLYVVKNGYTEAHYGLIQGMNGILIILFEIPLTALTAWLTYRAGVAAGFLLLGLGMAVNLCGGNLWIISTAMIVFTIGEMLCLPRHAAWVQQLSPPDMRGRFSGLVSFSWLGGNLLGTWLGFKLYYYDPNALWAVCGAAGILSAVILAAIRPYAIPATDDSGAECA